MFISLGEENDLEGVQQPPALHPIVLAGIQRDFIQFEGNALQICLHDIEMCETKRMDAGGV